MLVKLKPDEVVELSKYGDGPLGETGFPCLMASLAARLNEDTGEIDIGRDDIEAIEAYKQQGHKKKLEGIFKRAVDEAFDDFLK